MRAMAWDEFWWNHITGPQILVSSVATALIDGKNVTLRVPSDLPWRHSMRGAIHSELRDLSDSRDLLIELIDAVDEIPDTLDPGRYILDRFADETVKRGYREKSKQSIQEYIIQHHVIENHVIWIKGLTATAAESWISFCKRFSPHTYEEGLFVLEVSDNCHIQSSKYMQLIEYAQYVSSFDVRLLNSFILDSTMRESDPRWKDYIATVTAVVCDTDAEISEALISCGNLTREAVSDVLLRLSSMPEYERRGVAPNSTHILRLCRIGDMETIEKKIWAAQVQILFPIIELERIQIIQEWYERIDYSLSHQDVYQYGNQITNPIDVELGTLSYLLSKKTDDNQRGLYISDDAIRDRIRFLHDCRNQLAHATICSQDQVKTLLDNV